MKLKLSTGEGGAKAFFAKHIEKMLMGFVALISAFLVFSGLANREGIEPSKTPQDLQQKVTRTGQQIEDFSWDEYYRAERERDTNLAKIAEEALTTVPVDSYAVSQYPRPPFTPAQQRRTDPQLLVAQDVRAVAGNGILALQGVPGAERRNFDLGGTSVRQSRVEEIDSFVKPTSGAVPYQVSFVAVTALIPYQQQMDVYRDALMTRNEFDGKRDTPKYLDFEIDRAELTAPGATPNEADWQPIGNVSLALRYEGQYAGNVDEKVVLQNVSFDDFTDDKLTRELPPVKGVGDAPVWHNLAMHPGLMELALSMEEGKAGSTVGDGDEPGPVPFGAGDFNPTSAPVVDPSRRSLSRLNNGPTGGKNSDAESVVKYKLLRFFDFKSPLKPGSSYVYRVRLKLEDPNNPYDASQRPASRSLDASVADRLAREASTLAVGETHKFWRTSPNSAPSNPVLIQEASHIVMGKVTAPLMIVSRSGDLKIPSFGEEHVVGIVARRFDNDIKAIKSGYVETKRGGVADFVKGRIRVDDPLTADAQILEDGEIDTGTIVIDITGGEEIRETDLNAPGAVLLWNSDGSLDVRFELEDAPKFKELGLANADEEEEKRGRDRGRDRSTSERDERRDRENERRTRGAERNRPRRPPPENADILGEGR